MAVITFFPALLISTISLALYKRGFLDVDKQRVGPTLDLVFWALSQFLSVGNKQKTRAPN